MLTQPPLLLCCKYPTCSHRKSLAGDTSEPSLAAMKAMTKEQLLAHLNEQGVPAARELQRERKESRQMQAASRAALKHSARFARTTEGRKTWQTILTAHAYDRGRGAANGAKLPQGRDSRRSPVSILGRAAAGENAGAHPPSCCSIGPERVLVPTSSGRHSLLLSVINLFTGESLHSSATLCISCATIAAHRNLLFSLPGIRLGVSMAHGVQHLHCSSPIGRRFK